MSREAQAPEPGVADTGAADPAALSLGLSAAIAQFAETEKYAPNWGRLHLKWGEALDQAGQKEEAAKHFARAAALDLTPSEKAELARQP